MGTPELLHQARTVLESFGIEVKTARDQGRGYDVYLTRGATRAPYVVVAMRKVRVSDLMRREPRLPNAPILVVTDHVSPRTAAALRRGEIQYVDRSGNAYVHFGDVYLSVEGKPPQPGNSRHEYVGDDPVANLFSPRRAQVIMALITWPELTEAPVRTIADCAGTSVGIAQSTIKLLRSLDLWRREEPWSRDRLIDGWVASYPEGLGRSLDIDAFEGDLDLRSIRHSPSALFVSGEAVSDSLRSHETLTIYTDVFTPDLVVRNRWRRSTTPNIFVRHKFWRSPRRESAPGGDRLVEAPPIVVYADMMGANDSRVRAAAHEYRVRNRDLASHSDW